MRNWVLLLLALTSCSLVSCKGGGTSLPPDSKQSRAVEAVEITKLYPTDEWKAHILKRIEAQTGSDATSKFKAKIEQMYGADEINNFRLKLLRDTFTVGELRLIKEMLRNPEGKSTLQKMYIIDENLRAVVIPELTNTLSGR